LFSQRKPINFITRLPIVSGDRNIIDKRKRKKRRNTQVKKKREKVESLYRSKKSMKRVKEDYL